MSLDGGDREPGRETLTPASSVVNAANSTRYRKQSQLSGPRDRDMVLGLPCATAVSWDGHPCRCLAEIGHYT